MPQQPSVENNFTKGLITEATGLNFPENAATSTENCVYTLIGDVTRRFGINEELNGTTKAVTLTSQAISSYVWNNPGGDGNSKLEVKQVGQTLFFYNIATSTIASPLSTKILTGTVTLLVGTGTTFDSTKECTFADGNGWLFVYHPSCDTNYVTYDPVGISFTSSVIAVQTRDFIGVVDFLPVNTRPLTLSSDHQYNLQNQGWTSGNAWWAQDNTSVYVNLPLGGNTFTVQSGLIGVTNGQIVSGTTSGSGIFTGGFAGTVVSYSGTSLTINITQFVNTGTGFPTTSTVIVPISTGYLTTWHTAEGNFPSNADVWWYFKNTSDAFDPATTQPNVTVSTGNAPQGHYIMNEFAQNRALLSGISSVTSVSTTARPTNGAWFQGRVWYTGINGQQQASGDANYYTWTERIYFSQIVNTVNDFGNCYQTNDPTSEQLFDLLPTDGGVIAIVGSGTIHKLFPIANGLLVFANNGVWFITGSQGIGFSANDYTITKISSVRVLSEKSFVDVLGLPYFWNEEGIYSVMSGQNGQLSVVPLTVGTILSFYNEIPLASKKYARGAYDPINYIIQWCYKSVQEVSVTDRYQYDSILNFNTYNKAFYPYSVMTGTNSQFIHGISYVSYPFIGSTTPEPGFKYGVSIGGTSISFAEEFDTNYVDWGSTNYVSFFTTGYKVHGAAQRKFQVEYLLMYLRLGEPVAYKIQSIWDYANTGNSGRWSTAELTNIFNSNYDMQIKRHRVRGRGYVLQFKLSSVDGMPFDVMGWSAVETQNTGP